MTEPSPEEVAGYFADPHFPVLPPGCGAPHPEHPDVFCGRDDTCVEYHLATIPQADMSTKPITWPSDIKRPTREPDRKKASGMKDRAKAGSASTGDPKAVWQPPIVGTDDPANSHLAAERIEPMRGTRRAQVLDSLRAAKGQWVDAPNLATEEVGGFGGTRRMRELRDMGWDIETRPKPGATNTWQHRLVE